MKDLTTADYERILARADELYDIAKYGDDRHFRAPEIRGLPSEQPKALLRALLEALEGAQCGEST